MDKSGWIVSRVLAGQAQARGAYPFLQMVDGEPLSFAQTDAATTRLANGLLAHRLEPGEPVGVMLPNSIEICLTWFALTRLGAVSVFVNTAYKGIFLSHVLTNSSCRVLLVHREFLPWLAEIEGDLTALETAIVLGGNGEDGGDLRNDQAAFKRIRLTPFEPLMKSGAGADGSIELEGSYRELGAIMYTSGTTGPSKGVLMPHAHLYLFGLGLMENLKLTAEDIYYICMPLFHANALLMQLYGALIAGCRVVIAPRFSASGWLDDLRRHGATITNTLGVMNAFILRQPERPEEAEHNLRLICGLPTPPEMHQAFQRRFGIRIVEGYGMTEVNIPLYHPPDAALRPGSCGVVWERFFEVKVVDPDTDEERAPGELGEIVVRPREPFGFMQGYNAMAEKTVKAWRNFWFHTGDAGRRDGDGYFYFIDRIKDCIRVRGENLSSYQIETVLLDYPAVAEAAAIAVPSEIPGGEDEIKACLVLKPGAAADPERLLDHCRKAMPHFAVPRYVEILEALPKTPTEKVQKALLRQAGVTPATWDREQAGTKMRRGA